MLSSGSTFIQHASFFRMKDNYRARFTGAIEDEISTELAEPGISFGCFVTTRPLRTGLTQSLGCVNTPAYYKYNTFPSPLPYPPSPPPVSPTDCWLIVAGDIYIYT
jgi:hypothetical protein